MLEEDKGFGDVTSESVVDKNLDVNAYIISKDEGILAGMNLVKELFDDRKWALLGPVFVTITPYLICT